jgi:hypothetical protein
MPVVTHRQSERVDLVAFERQADETAAEARHEVDGFRSDRVRSHDEVALVLSLLVVDDDDHSSGGDIFERPVHAFDGFTAHLKNPRARVGEPRV